MRFDPPARGFPAVEFAARTERAQTLMAQAGLSGLLLTTDADIRYFSGFHTLFWQSPTRPWFLFIPAGGKPIALIPEIGAPLMHQTWIEDIRTWPAPRPDDDGISLLHDLLTPLARKSARIGVPKGPETHLRMPLADYDRLRAGLPNLKIADATPILRSLMMVKSSAEIEKIAHICTIGSNTFARLPEFAAEGMRLDDLFRAFRREMLAQGADDIPYLVGGAARGGYHDVISPPSGRRLAPGDVVMLDTGATWDGYFCDFDRNFAIGRADDATRKTYDTLWQATEAGLGAAHPGATCRAVFQAMRAVIGESGAEGGNVGRMGHGLGMRLTEWPSLADFDQTVIVENMVLTLEPSMTYGDGRMMVHEENIVIRAAGAELLSRRAAPDLPVIAGGRP
jgi:Xaa-Pro aminopeptidase